MQLVVVGSGCSSSYRQGCLVVQQCSPPKLHPLPASPYQAWPVHHSRPPSTKTTNSARFVNSREPRPGRPKPHPHATLLNPPAAPTTRSRQLHPPSTSGIFSISSTRGGGGQLRATLHIPEKKTSGPRAFRRKRGGAMEWSGGPSRLSFYTIHPPSTGTNLRTVGGGHGCTFRGSGGWTTRWCRPSRRISQLSVTPQHSLAVTWYDLLRLCNTPRVGGGV